jgi:hypothetical protein
MQPGDKKKKKINIRLFGGKEMPNPMPCRRMKRNNKISGNIPKVGQQQTLCIGS